MLPGAFKIILNDTHLTSKVPRHERDWLLFVGGAIWISPLLNVNANCTSCVFKG